MEAHLDHLAQAADGLRFLGKPDRYPWPDVTQAAGAVPLHVYRAVLALDAWDELWPVDQVALCTALADGHLIGEHTPDGLTGEFGDQLAHLAAECAYFADWCDPSREWPQADPERGNQLHRVAEHLTAYGALPLEWQAQVTHRLMPPCELSMRLVRALQCTRPAGPAPGRAARSPRRPGRSRRAPVR
ncbi:hypothetical protein [Streptomyces fulvoviolaceus]|uniref:hypothetical protein n=1 Tax=Streptomyces fulvoviolaceus TaxID=285535 RepID=UPI0004C9AF3A|nr:hypothetical protein [Streptomyces fulvoviolaceus]